MFFKQNIYLALFKKIMGLLAIAGRADYFSNYDRVKQYVKVTDTVIEI